MSVADLASLASSVAVVVSLVFLGLQIRQSNRNQRSLMQQGRSARNVELLSRLSDPRVSDVISRAANGEPLSDQDCFVLYGYLTSVFWSYEDCFFQFHLGMLDPKSWASDGTTLRRLLGNPAYRAVWRFGGEGSVMNTGRFWMDSPPNPGTTSRPICPTRFGNTSRKKEKRSRSRKRLRLGFPQFQLSAVRKDRFPWAFRPHGVLRLNCLAASTTVPAMKKSIIFVSAVTVLVMALVSCASNSNVDPFRTSTEETTPAYHEAAPAHSNIGGVPE